MANESKQAKERRAEPKRRQNAQDDHEGSAHDPAEFDVMNPQKQTAPDKEPPKAASDKPD